jgi:hypothetical protein
VWFESDDERGFLQSRGEVPDLGEDMLMAPVTAVEIADCDDGALKGGGHIVQPVKHVKFKQILPLRGWFG